GEYLDTAPHDVDVSAGGTQGDSRNDYTRSEAALLADLGTLTTLFEQGCFRAVIDRRYALADLAHAYRYVATGRKRGNVVINIPHGV
ncbi:MAG: zinc-binding dehydrogenase, partial [Planctomycetota bacterium]